MRQACAAIGQPLLMAEYKKAFGRYDITVAQVLLTAEVLNNRKTYLNLRNSIETLLNLGVVPILNENDSVSTEEIGSAFGDNDKLSALVASKLDADLLDYAQRYRRTLRQEPAKIQRCQTDTCGLRDNRGNRQGRGRKRQRIQHRRDENQNRSCENRLQRRLPNGPGERQIDKCYRQNHRAAKKSVRPLYPDES